MEKFSRRTVVAGVGAATAAALVPAASFAAAAAPPLDLEEWFGDYAMQLVRDRYGGGRLVIGMSRLADDALFDDAGRFNLDAPFRLALSKHLHDGEDAICRASWDTARRNRFIVHLTRKMRASNCGGVFGELARPPHDLAILVTRDPCVEHRRMRFEGPQRLFRSYEIW